MMPARRHGLLIGAASVVLSLGLWFAGVLDGWERTTWDWRVRLFARPGPDTGDVVLVLLDQASLDWAYDSIRVPWPWPREVYAPLIDFCTRGGAKAVGFDVLYTEPSFYGAEDDQALGEAISRNKRFVGARFLESASALAPADRIVEPIPAVAEAAALLANVSDHPDPDGIYRRASLLMYEAGHEMPVPSLGVGVWLQGGGDLLDLLRRAHLAPDGTALLRYRGGLDAFTTYTAASLIQSELRLLENGEPTIDPATLSGKYVIFGFSAPGLQELRSTPLGHVSPGVLVRATVLDNLLSDSFMDDLPREWSAVGALLIGLLTGFLMVTVSGIRRAVPLFAGLLLLPSAAGLVAYSAGWWAPVLPGTIATAAAIVGGLVRNYALKISHRRIAEAAFRHHASELASDHPDPLLDLTVQVFEDGDANWEHETGGPEWNDERPTINNLRLLHSLGRFNRRIIAGEDPDSVVQDLTSEGRRRDESMNADTSSSVIDHPEVWRNLHLRRKLGVGTSAEVYLAWDPRLERDVALKLFTSDTGHDEGPGALAASTLRDADGVINEGKLMARVRHPNIVSVYGADQAGGRVGIWMDYIRGRTLSEVLHEQGPLGAREAIGIGLDLCQALAAVHAAGLIHQDVKAQNVMREEGGRIVLMDFGVGIEIGAQLRASGTPYYMAPEAWLDGVTSPRADIYSLGVLLFHLVTGRFPVEADNLDGLVAAHRKKCRHQLRDLRPDLPAEFVRVIEQALSVEPDDRQQSMGVLESDLSGAATPRVKSRRSERTHMRWVQGIGAGLVVLLAAVGIWRLMHLGQAQPPLEPSREPQHVQLTFTGEAHAPRISPDGDFVAYRTSNQQIMVHDLLSGTSRDVYQGPVGDLEWSPNGSHLAITSLDGATPRLKLIPRYGGNPREIDAEIGSSSINWLPDGRSIETHGTSDNYITLIDLETRTTETVDIPGDFQWLDYDGVRISPDGRRLATIVRDDRTEGALRVHDLGAETFVTHASGQISSPRFSCDGNAIYYLNSLNGSRDLWRVEISGETGQQDGTGKQITHGISISDFSLAASRSRIAYERTYSQVSISGMTLDLVNSGDVASPVSLAGGTQEIGSGTLSPDGRQVAYVRPAKPQNGVYLTSLVSPGGETRLTFMEGEIMSRLAWSPAGDRLAFSYDDGSGSFRIWTVDTATGATRVFENSKSAYDLTWAPGKKIIYQRPGSHNYHMLDPDSGEETPMFAEGTDGWMSSPAVSPDESSIAFIWRRSRPGDSMSRLGLWTVSLDNGRETCLFEFPEQYTHLCSILGWNERSSRIYMVHELDTDMQIVQAVDIDTGFTRSFENSTGVRGHLVLPDDWGTPTDISRNGEIIILRRTITVSDIWVVDDYDDFPCAGK